MHRRTAATRLVLLITLTALTASLVGTVAVQAERADPLTVSSGSTAIPRARPPAFGRSGRSTCKPAGGDRQGLRYDPVLRRPEGIGSPATVRPRAEAPPFPAQATTNGDPANHPGDRLPRVGGRFQGRHRRRTARSVGRGRPGARGPGRQPRLPHQRSLRQHPPDHRHVRLLRPGRVLQPGRGRLLRSAGDLRQPPCPLVRGRGQLRLLHDAAEPIGTGYLDFAISDGPDPTAGWRSCPSPTLASSRTIPGWGPRPTRSS